MQRYPVMLACLLAACGGGENNTAPALATTVQIVPTAQANPQTPPPETKQ